MVFWYFVDGLDAENVHEDENAVAPTVSMQGLEVLALPVCLASRSRTCLYGRVEPSS